MIALLSPLEQQEIDVLPPLLTALERLCTANS